jgi:ATP adenylyltransferase
MERLYTPWRIEYVKNAVRGNQQCIFCVKDDSNTYHESLILRVSDHSVVMCNRYPYTSGHLLIAPREHIADFSTLGSEVAWEMFQLIQESIRIIKREYAPEGFNVGMNTGKAAGAGIEEHLHFHVLPRWTGDTNFMTSLNEVRVLPETVSQTYERLLTRFKNLEIS